MIVYANGRLSVKCDLCSCIVFDYPTTGFLTATKGKLFKCSGCFVMKKEEVILSSTEKIKLKNKKYYEKHKEYIDYKTKKNRKLK